MGPYDQVCGMDLAGLDDLRQAVSGGLTSHFCSDVCLDRFRADPEKYSGTPVLASLGITKKFVSKTAETQVLRGLDLRIWKGDFVAVIGPSGSGKSTVLGMLGLLDRPTTGQVFVNGRDMTGSADAERAELRSRTFGFVFQQYNLIPWLTAYENALLPTVFSKRSGSEAAISARFRELGLADRLGHRPTELSGGEQQRVATIRALANEPPVILADEPTGNLDSVTGAQLLALLTKMNKVEGKTLVVVTHDAEIAEQADQIITLKDGRVIRNHGSHKKLYTA